MLDKDGQRRVNGDRFWRPFKLALESGNPKMVETTLDAVQKLIAFRTLRGSLYDAKTNTLLINEVRGAHCAQRRTWKQAHVSLSAYTRPYTALLPSHALALP